AAPERLKDSRLLMSTTTVKKLPPHVVSALANGLQVERENRITDFDELRSQLSVAHRKGYPGRDFAHGEHEYIALR
ncbi:MAG: hypothetical protein II246_00005, partial [Ruminococcus sp.]|nr:hypothetical protein [Ruminococcus sp.]